MTAESAPPARHLVSIIIPAKNARRWIGESVGSALAQTYAPIEVIVVDNSSQDGTAEVVRAMRQDNLTVIVERKPGPSAARNAGLAAARGEFIQFLDADDALLPGKIAVQAAHLSDRVDIVWGPFVRAVDDGRPLVAHTSPTVDPALGEDVEASLLAPDGFLHLGATLIRRAAIGDIRFDETVHVVEDVRFLVALAARGARFTRTPSPSGYVMREHDSEGRASRVANAVFWTSCNQLATDAASRWTSSGTITPARAETLGQIFVAVARNLSATDIPAANEAIARARALTPRYYKSFPFWWRTIVRAVGFQRAELLGRALRRARRRFRD